MTDDCYVLGCGKDASVDGRACGEHHEKHWEGSTAPDGVGSAFAEELLYIKWVDSDEYYGAATSWVDDCPDDVYPRSEKNPHVYTWGETWDDDWGSADREHWYIVGARGDSRWVGVDLDVDQGHEARIDFDMADFRVPSSGALMALSKSGGLHAYVIARSEPPALTTNYDGVDLLSDSENISQRGAISPWHDGRRAVVNDAEPVPMDDKLREGRGSLFTVEGRDEPVLVPDSEAAGSVDVDIPDDAPDEMPLCVKKLAATRADPAERRNYADHDPWKVDTHLGQLLIANGYGVDQALAVFRDYPKNGDPGDFDAEETRYQLRKLEGKLTDGEMSPPRMAVVDAGLDISDCSCRIHGSRAYAAGGNDAGHLMPLAESGFNIKRSEAVKQRAQNQVRRDLGGEIEGSFTYHAPQGLGKTVSSSAGAAHQKRLILTANKDEHRDTVKWAAETNGVSYREIVPFGESWLATQSPVKEEVNELYEAGVRPRYITAEYGDLVPEEAHTPYLDQFEGDPPDEDLLIGSPGHENVLRFRTYPDGDELGTRAVIHDDTHPASSDIVENSFTMDDARAGINELLQEIPDLESGSLAQLMRNRDDRRRVERLAVATGGSNDDDEERGEAEDVWEALERAADEADAITVDIVDVVRRRSNVRGDTIIQLKVLAGCEIRNVEQFSWRDESGTERFSWVSHPDLREHDVVIASATPVPHVGEKWLAESCGGFDGHRSIDEDWYDVRAAQGYLLVQTTEARNSRSGGGSFSEDPGARREAMVARREDLADAVERAEGERPTPVDAKKLLEEGGDGAAINFARVWSNNDLKDENVGLVAGATYYGDEWVRMHAAYLGRHAEIRHPDGEPASATDPVSQDLLDFMVRAPVEQAVTRYGRDNSGVTRVYVDTREIPADFPAVDASDHVETATETEIEVFEAVRGGAETVKEIADEVGVTRRQVNNVVNTLDERGKLRRLGAAPLPYGQDRIVPADEGSSAVKVNTVELPSIPRAERGRAGSEGHRVKQRSSGGAQGAQSTLDAPLVGTDDDETVPGSDVDRDVDDGFQVDMSVWADD